VDKTESDINEALFGTVEKEPMLVAVGQGLGYRGDMPNAKPNHEWSLDGYVPVWDYTINTYFGFLEKISFPLSFGFNSKRSMPP
jgi:hypothetical protein